MKMLFNNGAYFVAIFPSGHVRIGNVTGLSFDFGPTHRLYAACVTERQPGTVKMLYDTLCDEYLSVREE
jgi:hypothetical protein